MMQRIKAKLMIKEACIISVFFPQIIKSYIWSMSVGNSYERYSQPLNISIPEVCTTFVHQPRGIDQMFPGIDESQICDSATKKKKKKKRSN